MLLEQGACIAPVEGPPATLQPLAITSSAASSITRSLGLSYLFPEFSSLFSVFIITPRHSFIVIADSQKTVVAHGTKVF